MNTLTTAPTNVAFETEARGIDIHDPRQAAILTLGRRVIETSSVQLLLRDAGQLLAETADADASGVAELTSDGQQIKLRISVVAEEAAPTEHLAPPDGKTSLAAYCLSAGNCLVVDDLATDPRLIDPVLYAEGYRSAVACLVKLADGAFGSLAIYSRRTSAFGPQDALFAETICHLLAATIARQRAEQALEEQQQFVQAVLDNVPALVLKLSPDGKIRSINQTAQRVSGFSAEEIHERPVWSALLVAEEVKQVQQALECLRVDPASSELSSFILTKQGDRRRIAWSFNALRGAAQESAGILATGIDITEVCELKDSLARAQKWAGKATQKLQQAISPAQPAATQPIGHPTTDGLRETAARPFERLPEGVHKDRRAKPRRSYPYFQLIAAMVGDRLPDQNAFREIRCKDISAGGFSFLAPAPPQEKNLVVAFGSGAALTYVTARIAHATRVMRDGQTMYMVGCHYTGRATY